jgi:DNA-binding MarR family transcriptional regulator
MSAIMTRSIDNVNKQAMASPSAEDVFDAIHAVMHLYRAQQYRQQRDSGHELTHMDSKVLRYFDRHPGATQKDLAHDSGRDKGQLARLISALRERGLLEGTPDEADRRIVRLRLTAEGRAVHQALQRRARRVNELAVVHLSEAERRELTMLLEKVHAGLAAEPDQ